MDYKINDVILVPTDFTEVGDFAIEHAAGCAQIVNSRICIFHVINKDTKSYLKKNNLSQETIDEKLKQKAEEVKRKYNIEAEYMSREGSIFTTISEVALELGAVFIVLGTHGKVGMQHLVGSFARKVVISAPCPTLVVQEREFRGYKNMLIPIDNNSNTRQKMKWAIYLAKKFNSKMYLFPKHTSDEFLLRKIMGVVKQIKNVLDKNGVAYEDLVSNPKGGNYSRQLLEFSEKVDADIILIMTNPDQFLPSFILEPWSEQLMFNAQKIPVLCTNPRELGIPIIGL